MKIVKLFCFPLLLVACYSCSGNNGNSANISNDTIPEIASKNILQSNGDGIKTIHVFVALCDNKYQGIVPVPASIGNGQDAKNNLYWGAANGVKSYFIRSKDWQLISSQKNNSENILERLLFKHKSKNVYLLADAYDGQFIKQTTIDFLNASSGRHEVMLQHGGQKIYFGGAANLLAYIGHDGLMDFSLNEKFIGDSSQLRETIILACYSKRFFSGHLKQTGAKPLIWTSGLMAPEAYTLHDAITEWIADAKPKQVRIAAAKAYSKYQKCSIKAAQNLLVQGW